VTEEPVVSRIRGYLKGVDRVFVSRGLAPGWRAGLAAVTRTVELPCVRGEAVLPPDLSHDDVVVIGHPNWLGCFDPAPLHARAIVVAEPRLGAHRPLPSGDAVVVGGVADPETATAGLHRARKLAKGLKQLPGVMPAYGTPQSAVFVVLLGVDPGPVSAVLPGSAEAVSGAYPELPGGVRIDASGVAETDVAAYAAAMEYAVRNARG
jgi:hypothetical protein